MIRLNITIEPNSTAHSSDRSSSSVSEDEEEEEEEEGEEEEEEEEEEDSSGTGVQVSPSSAQGYSETLEDGWLLTHQQPEIGPSESASRPPTSHQHRYPPPAPEPEPPHHTIRRVSTHNRPHRQSHPRAHRPQPPITSESVDSNEEWAGHAPGGYARGPPQHHARTYPHWGNVGAPTPQNYTSNYSSGHPYGQYAPTGAIAAGQQLVPFAGPNHSYGYSPFQAAPGGVPPGYYPTQQPGGVHMTNQTHGVPPYRAPDMMHHAPGGGYFAYGAQPYPIPQAHVFHPYPAVYSPPPTQTPPPAPVVDTSKDDEKFARIEKILMDQKAEQEAKEAAAIKAAADNAAKAANDEKIAADISAAASAAAAAATVEAEKKAADNAAKKIAEEAAKKAAEDAEKKKAEADAAVVSAAAAAAASAAAAAAPPPPPEEKKKPIRFKDAVGRKYSFPFHLCNTWPVSSLRSRNATYAFIPLTI